MGRCTVAGSPPQFHRHHVRRGCASGSSRRGGLVVVIIVVIGNNAGQGHGELNPSRASRARQRRRRETCRALLLLVVVVAFQLDDGIKPVPPPPPFLFPRCKQSKKEDRVRPWHHCLLLLGAKIVFNNFSLLGHLGRFFRCFLLCVRRRAGGDLAARLSRLHFSS
jgi:hypothetical protein